jgi:hypothetical protein
MSLRLLSSWQFIIERIRILVKFHLAIKKCLCYHYYQFSAAKHEKALKETLAPQDFDRKMASPTESAVRLD